MSKATIMKTGAAIIGAGPVGSYLGYLLSKEGVQNTIVEEHPQIGKPEQCTGLISRNIEELMDPSWFRKAIQNKVNGAVISCCKERFEVRSKDFKAYVLDRSSLDKAIAEKAQKEGSKLLLDHRYEGYMESHALQGKGLKIGLKSGQKAEFLHSSVLVGADGPASKVAKDSFLYGGRKFWVGTQAMLSTKKPFFEKDRVYLFLDSRYSDGFFAWVVPIDENKAKVGLASKSDPKGFLDRFLKDKFEHFVVEGRQAGLIPVYKRIPLQNRQKSIFLVGDAALQCKATTGGGVINGLLAAKGLAGSIASGRSDYERRIRGVRRNLWDHSMIRGKLDRMSDSRKAEMIRAFNDERVKKVLEEKGDMDFVARFGFRLLLAKPGLMRFVI